MNRFREFVQRAARNAASGAGGSAGKGAGGAGGGGGGGGIPGAVIAGTSLIFATGLVLTGLSYSLVMVDPGSVGIVYSRLSGLDNQRRLTEGWNVLVPWFQRAVIYDIRAKAQQIDSHSGSKDLQIVQISLRILYRPDQHELPAIYRKLGKDYAERVLPSIVNEVTKAVIAQYNAAELITKREAVSTQIREHLAKRANDFHILLEDVSIKHLDFSKVAQQDAERSRYVVDKAIQEKKAIIIKAEGEAQSAQLIGAAIRDNPAFIQLRRIESSKEVATLISQSQNKIYLDANALLINQLGDKTDEQDRQERVQQQATTTTTSGGKAKATSGSWF